MKYSKSFLRIYKKIAVPFYKIQAGISQKFAKWAHKGLMIAEWCIDNPEYYNHDMDLYYQWGTYGRAYWVERGVYNILALQNFEKPVLIELCCGEGFNTKYFYSKNATHVYACDFCEKAIKEAKKKYSMDNIEFCVADIRNDIPNSVSGMHPTNIIWDAAIEHFTPQEISDIMNRIHEVLSYNKGILSGYTIVEKEGMKSLEQHEYEFRDMDDLKRFLSPYFKNVTVFETIYDDRHNLYFWASDSVIPFAVKWSHYTKTEEI